MNTLSALKEKEDYRDLEEIPLVEVPIVVGKSFSYDSKFEFGANEVRYVLREHYKTLGFGIEGVNDKDMIEIMGGIENILNTINRTQSVSFNVGSRFDWTSKLNFYRGKTFAGVFYEFGEKKDFPMAACAFEDKVGDYIEKKFDIPKTEDKDY